MHCANFAVHLLQVIDEVDGGANVMQLITPVVPGETAESLKAKVCAKPGAVHLFTRLQFCRPSISVERSMYVHGTNSAVHICS